MFRCRFLQCANFASEGDGLIDGGADLDEVLRVVEVAGEKIHLEAARRLHVGELGLAALKLDEDGGFEVVAGIGFSTTIKDRLRIRCVSFFRRRQLYDQFGASLL